MFNKIFLRTVILQVVILFTTLYILNFDVLSAVAVAIFAYSLLNLLAGLNDSLPIKELVLTMYAVQYLLSPALTYNGFEDYNISSYLMKIERHDYFSYAIPAYLSMLFGLGCFIKNGTQVVSRNKLNNWLVNNPHMPYVLVFVGFLGMLIKSLVPVSLQFFVYIMSNLHLVGLILLIFSYKPINYLLLLMVFITLIVSSLIETMFYDFLIWFIYVGFTLAYRLKPSRPMIVLTFSFFLILVVFIQTIKFSLRDEKSGQGDLSGTYLNSAVSNSTYNGGNLFSIENIGPKVNRINQGWILASTINQVPKLTNHTRGVLFSSYTFSAILPRVVAPDKVSSGDASLFSKYSGHAVESGTSMALGLFPDAYVDFGLVGGCIFLFFFGVVLSRFIIFFFRKGNKYPFLYAWMFLVLLFIVRPDCETQTILGHMFKTTVLVFPIFFFLRKYFKSDYVKV